MTIPGFELRACPVCGSTDESTVIAEATFDPATWEAISFSSRKLPEYVHHRIVSCPECDTAYASPAPEVVAVETRYESSQFVSGVESRYAAETYGRAVSRLVLPRLRRLRTALDIGASDGSFLEKLLDLGFDDVCGVEPAAGSVQAAPDRVRAKILTGAFSRSLFAADDSFDLVTILQTLEHVADPISVVRASRELLSDGGALFVVVHDRRAWLNRALGVRSPIYDVEHLQLFSDRSARSLLKRAGLSDVSVRRLRNRYPLGYWLLITPLPRALKQPLLWLLRRSRVGLLPIPFSPGNIAVIGWARQDAQ